MAEAEVVEASALTKLIVQARERGKSFAQIAEDYDLTPEKAYADYMRFMEAQNTVNEHEYRLLQLRRLERLIDKCWELVEVGSVDHMKITLSVIKEISALLGLHKEKAQQIVQVIDQRQVTLVTNYVDAVSETLKAQVLQALPPTTKKSRATIEAQWDSWVADASAEPLKTIEQDRVQV